MITDLLPAGCVVSCHSPSSSMSSPGSSAVALLNPLILDIIFYECERGDNARFSYVCSAWMSVASNYVWRRNPPLSALFGLLGPLVPVECEKNHHEVDPLVSPALLPTISRRTDKSFAGIFRAHQVRTMGKIRLLRNEGPAPPRLMGKLLQVLSS